MDEIEKILKVCEKFDAIPLLGRCLQCESSVANKSAIVNNCVIKELEYDYPHKAVMAFLCGKCYNGGDVRVEDLREAITTLNPMDWKVI